MKYDIVIIGAGISGLTLGWYLQKHYGNQISLKILEKSSRPGGWIRTSSDDGFLFEQGPRSCRSKGSGISTLRLVESLGLQNDLIAASKDSLRRYLYFDGKLQQIPTSLFSFLNSPFTRKIFKALYREWKIPAGKTNDTSIFDFVSRRLGSDIAETFFDPLVSGIFAGDMRQLSMHSCFPKIYELEQKHGSLLKGAWNSLREKSSPSSETAFIKAMQKTPIFSFKRGTETLIQALVKHLTSKLQLECEAIEVKQEPTGILIQISNGLTYRADKVFIAIPASHAAQLLKKSCPDISVQMSSIPTASVAVVNMGWKTKVLQKKGFGYLIPTQERERLLGVVWDSSVFPQQNLYPEETRLTAMLGGVLHPNLIDLSENEIWALVQSSIRKHLGIASYPDVIKIIKARKAIPQYILGHNEKIKSIETVLEAQFFGHIKLLGNSWHGIGINDCIAEAERMANNAIKIEKNSKYPY